MTKLTDVIAPSFYILHREIAEEAYTHYWLKGGRGSTKSSFTATEIVLGMMKHSDANAVVIRKVYHRVCLWQFSDSVSYG